MHNQSITVQYIHIQGRHEAEHYSSKKGTDNKIECGANNKIKPSTV